MQFLMMLKIDRDKSFTPSPELMREMDKLTEETVKAGIMLQTGGMASTAKVTRIAADSGKLSVTDGPFAESKEQVGGYAIVEVKSREEALALAKRFMEIHVKILGSSFTGESEIREMFPYAGVGLPVTEAPAAGGQS